MSNPSDTIPADLLDRVLAWPTPVWGSAWLDYRGLGVTADDEQGLIGIACDAALLDAEQNTPESWAPVHAWRSLGQLESRAAIGPLLSLLSQRGGDDDWLLDDLQEVFASLGPAAVQPLSAFAADRSHDIFDRAAVAESLARIATRHESEREGCVATLTRLLDGFAHEEPVFNALIIGNLMSLRVTEAAPLMQAAFDAERVDIRSIGDWEDVQIELGLLSERQTPRPPLEPDWDVADFDDEERQPLAGWSWVDPEAAAAYEQFLAGPKCPKGALSPRALEGFLFAVACAPEVVRPSEWIALVLGEGHEFEDEEEARKLLTGLITLLGCIQESVGEAEFDPPLEVSFRDDVLSNLDDDADVSQWSHGFVIGHTWLDELWAPAVDLGMELGGALFALSFFSSRKVSEGFQKELLGGEKSLEELAEMACDVWPEALMDYAATGRALFSERQMKLRPQPVRATPEQRTGRNDPCPCGSGRKFKKCCGSVAGG